MAVDIVKRGGPESAPENRSSALLVKKQIAMGMGSNANDIEDEFEHYYFDPSKPEGAQIIRPEYEPRILLKLCEQNNSLGQLIEAMEVNIDGTSYEFVRLDGTPPDDDDPEKAALDDFFDEVWPGMSFTTLRRKLRIDQEATGNAYMEAVRSVAGDLTFLRYLPATTMRLVRLDEPAPVSYQVRRGGKWERVTMMARERRYAQIVGNRLVYFKQYGASRHLNKNTGEWGADIPVDLRATEVRHFTARKPSTSPYGLPRWINNIPSALGSRKAEEHNLDFFDAGGMPPVMIFISGGALSSGAKTAMDTFLSNKNRNVHRAGVFDVHSTGSLDSANSVKIAVERFGAERQQDSMFENYDAKCEQRLRGSFRLPPLFVGKAGDYSFATAYASYMVAEAQVFQPEREEFDEIMNSTIMRELSTEYRLRSLQLSVKDIENQIKGLEMVKDKLPTEDLLRGVNEVTGLQLPTDVVLLPPPDTGGTGTDSASGNNDRDEDAPSGDNVVAMPATKSLRSKSQTAVFNLVGDYAAKMLKGEDTSRLDDIVQALPQHQRDQFDAALTLRLMSGMDHDREGAQELVGAAVNIMSCTSRHLA